MSLKDITNTCDFKGVMKKKRLVDGSIKVYKYERSRKTFEIQFENDAEKMQFSNKVELFKKQHGLKCMKELLEFCISDQTDTSKPEQLSKSFILEKCEHDNFICENKSLVDLVTNVQKHSRRCGCNLVPESFAHKGHVLETKWQCKNGHILQWNSSSELGKNYTINYRIMLAYLCSGITQIQYERFSDFAEYGILTEHFRLKSALTCSAVIEVLAEQSISFALSDECHATKDRGEDGISIMTDARHQCRKNSYHTDHVTLGQHTHKVVNLQHITKTQEPCTQKHETIGCSQMYEQFDRRNIKINVHAHDRNMSVNKTVRTRNDGVKNCNERWHATKPLTKGLKKISQGANKNMGVTWHPSLADKGSRLRNHLYYAIDNCNEDEHVLRDTIDLCILHFQDIHDRCTDDSACKEAGYVPDFTVVREPVAIRLLTEFLHSLTLYKNAKDYVYSKDTYYVESFNNSVLIYLQKRIHYKDLMYRLRMNLAVLNWNEHVDRPFTSRSSSEQVHHNRRHLGKKRHKKKTYIFVSDIWELLVGALEEREILPVQNVGGFDNDDGHYDELTDD